mgnify:CR=1 FL=1
MLFSCCTVIGVRDGETSADLARSIAKKSSQKILNTGDDALLVPPASSFAVNTILKTEGVPDNCSSLVMVNLRDSSSYNASYSKPPFSIAATVLDKLLEERADRHVVFVSISYHGEDGDNRSAKKIKEHMKHADRSTIINNEYSPSEIKGLISQAEISIGTSYHFLLFSLSQNIPSLAIYQDQYYKKKLVGLTKMYGQRDFCFNLKKLNSSELLRISNEVIDLRPNISEDLSQINRDLNVKFKIAHDYILEIL